MATPGTAWSAAILTFDTAPHTASGFAEQRGAFLRQRSRAAYTLSTKAGRLHVPDPDRVDGSDTFFGAPSYRQVLNYSTTGVEHSLADSLDRLGLKGVDRGCPEFG